MRKRHDNSPPETGKLFTIAEVASRWRVTDYVVSKALRDGRLQGFKPGGRFWRIREAELLRYESAQGTAVAS